MAESVTKAASSHEAALKAIVDFSTKGITAMDAVNRMREIAQKALKK